MLSAPSNKAAVSVNLGLELRPRAWAMTIFFTELQVPHYIRFKAAMSHSPTMFDLLRFLFCQIEHSNLSLPCQAHQAPGAVGVPHRLLPLILPLCHPFRG